MKKRMAALLAALALALGLAGCGGSSNMASGGSTAAARYGSVALYSGSSVQPGSHQ